MKSDSSINNQGASSIELLTVKETCDKLRISPWSFHQLVNRRELKTIKIGRRRLVPLKAIEEFIEKHSEEVR